MTEKPIPDVIWKCLLVCVELGESGSSKTCSALCLGHRPNSPNKKHNNNYYLRKIKGDYETLVRKTEGEEFDKAVFMDLDLLNEYKAKKLAMPLDVVYALDPPTTLLTSFGYYCTLALLIVVGGNVRTALSPSHKITSQYLKSWQDGTQQRLVIKFTEHVREGTAFKVAAKGWEKINKWWGT